MLTTIERPRIDLEVSPEIENDLTRGEFLIGAGLLTEATG